VIVELDHAVRRGFGYPVGKNSAPVDLTESAEACPQPRPVKEVVPQHECCAIRPNVGSADDERPSEPVWNRLNCIADGDTELETIAQQPAECFGIGGRSDDQDVAYTRKYERRQRVVDHRFVKNRQQLLARTQSYWMQSRTGSPRKNDSPHAVSLPGVADVDQTDM
jgi:hypothetical protein